MSARGPKRQPEAIFILMDIARVLALSRDRTVEPRRTFPDHASWRPPGSQSAPAPLLLAHELSRPALDHPAQRRRYRSDAADGARHYHAWAWRPRAARPWSGAGDGRHHRHHADALRARLRRLVPGAGLWRAGAGRWRRGDAVP